MREGIERGQCCCLASGVLSGKKLSSGICPDARQFNFSPYTTGALPAVSVLKPRGSESVSPKRRLLRTPQFLPPLQPPLASTARSYGNFSSWQWNPGLGSLVWGLDPLLLKYPSQFLSTTRGYGTACSTSLGLCVSLYISTSLALLPIWMNVTL